MRNRGTGAGGANTNKSGLQFEDSILGHLKNGQEYDFGTTTLRFFKKGEFLREMQDLKNVEFQHNKQPDGIYVSKDKKTIFILELKNQNESGSVDEKLMIGPGLLYHYKVMYPSIENIHLCYIVNGNFFRQKKYEVTVNFLKQHNIPVFYADTISYKLKMNDLGSSRWSDCMIPFGYRMDHTIIHDWIMSKL